MTLSNVDHSPKSPSSGWLSVESRAQYRARLHSPRCIADNRHSRAQCRMALRPEGMKILNAYCGIGGNRKNWGDDHRVTAIELDPETAAIYKELYPRDEVVVGDAHDYIRQHFNDFDLIWASPPCTTHSRLRWMIPNRVYPDMRLYQEIILLRQFHCGYYLIENVNPYYAPLIKESAQLGRHLVWSNFPIDVSGYAAPGSLTPVMSSAKRLADYHGIHLPEHVKNKALLLRNAVHPGMGEFVLNQLHTHMQNQKGPGS